MLPEWGHLLSSVHLGDTSAHGMLQRYWETLLLRLNLCCKSCWRNSKGCTIQLTCFGPWVLSLAPNMTPRGTTRCGPGGPQQHGGKRLHRHWAWVPGCEAGAHCHSKYWRLYSKKHTLHLYTPLSFSASLRDFQPQKSLSYFLCRITIFRVASFSDLLLLHSRPAPPFPSSLFSFHFHCIWTRVSVLLGSWIKL